MVGTGPETSKRSINAASHCYHVVRMMVAVVADRNQAAVCPLEPLLASGTGFVPLPASETRDAHTTQERHGHTQKLSLQTPLEPLSLHPCFFALQGQTPLPSLSGLLPVCTTIYLASAVPSEWNTLPTSAHLVGSYSHLTTLLRHQHQEAFPEFSDKISKSQTPNPILYCSSSPLDHKPFESRAQSALQPQPRAQLMVSEHTNSAMEPVHTDGWF